MVRFLDWMVILVARQLGADPACAVARVRFWCSVGKPRRVWWEVYWRCRAVAP